MKKFYIVFTFCLALAGMCRAEENHILKTIFGIWPKWHFEVTGGGTGGQTAATSQISYTQAYALFGRDFGKYNQVKNTSTQGILGSVKYHITSKIWLEGEYSSESATQTWKYTEPGYETDLGTITINTSPTLSLNYILINIHNVCLYGGGGWNQTSVSGTHHVYNGDVPTTIDGGGSNLLGRVGIIFPTWWDRLSGSIGFQGGKSLSLSTPIINGGEKIETTGFSVNHFSASLSLALF